MGCSCTGLLAIFVSGLAMVLSSISLGLPLWSAVGDLTRKSFVSTDSIKSDLSAGVWGICLKVDFASESELSECYLYYSNTDSKLISNDNRVTTKSVSLCSLYDKLTPTQQKLAQTSVLGLSGKFLDRTCSAHGKSTLAFAILAPSFATFSFVFMLLGITCCKKDSRCTGFSIFMAFLAMFASILAFGLWVAQANSLDDAIPGMKFHVSFYFAIFAAIASGTSIAFSKCHMQKGREEERQENNYNTQNSNQRPVAGGGSNLV